MKWYRYTILIVVLGTLVLNAKNLKIEAKKLSLNLKSYKVLDARSNDLYLKGHIKGTLSFPANLTYENKKISGKLTNPTKMQKIIRGLGLTTNSKIVIYDDGSFFDAARLFWSLEVYGFKNIKLLNSSYKNWVFDGYKTSTKKPTIRKSNYIAQINYKRLATKFTTLIASNNPNQTIIDARGHKSYIGEKSVAKRFGHIPKALNIPATDNINYKGKIEKLKTIKNLKKLYKNIDKKQKVIIYCGIGRISATDYFALRELGYDVANYDGSWKEWGNDLSLPIVKLRK